MLVKQIWNMIDFMGSTDHVFEETPYENMSFPLKCWNAVNLSDVWIPTHLLPSRNEPNFVEPGNIFESLKKKDEGKCIESFSVYSDEEFYQSDSDDDLLVSKSNNFSNEANDFNHLNSISENEIISFNSKKVNDEEKILLNSRNNFNDKNVVSNLDSSENSKMQICSSDSKNFDKTYFDINYNMNIKCHQKDEINLKDPDIALNDILDNSLERNIKEFSFNIPEKCLEKFAEKEQLKVNKSQRKHKRKEPKHLHLEQFLDEIPDINNENSCFEEFYNNIRYKNEYCQMQIKNDTEFPDLASKDPVFIKSSKHSKQDQHENQTITFKSVAKIFNELLDNEEQVEAITDSPSEFNENSESTIKKFVIENIPPNVSKDDLHTLLLGYGEIISFSLEATGNSCTAFVEMDLVCDIDWIVDCLNGSEPFGTFTETLKCYKI